MDCYVGEIRLFAGSYAPVGWHLCDGTILTIKDYEILFSTLGTIWGGNGTTTFALPDLRGRLPIGQGQGTGLTARTLGQTGGTEAVTVVEAGMPVHTHTFNASSGPTTTNNPNGTMHAALPAGEVQFLTAAHTATTTSTFVLAPNTVLPVGSSLGHNNVMPSLPLNYIIATTGIYPQPA